MRLCEMPRNLRRYSRLSLPRPSVKIFSIEEVQTHWKDADQRLRCFMALALNAGMGQKDISDLRMREVDWDRGYIERGRSKTGVRGRYKLWPATLELMQAVRSPQAHINDDRVFLNANGLPLLRRECVDGKLKFSDAIRNLFWRLQRRTGINDGRGFYCLRKSAATEIQRIQATVTEMFLAHAERGMKKHYVEWNWAALDGVLDQLKEVYALCV